MDIGSLLTVLWPYLAVLYALDCFLIVRGGHLLFKGNTHSGFRLKGPGLHMAGVSPWDWSVLSSMEPLLFTERGFYFRNVPLSKYQRPPHPDDFQFIPIDEVHRVERNGQKITLNGEGVCTAPTGPAAVFLVRKIREFIDIPVRQRAQSAEDFMEDTFNPVQARAVVKKAVERTSNLVRVSCVLFLLLGFVLPMALALRLSFPWLWALLVVILITYLSILVLWWRAHRSFWPGEVGERLEELAVLVFFPVSAVHILRRFTRRLLVPFDSAVISVVLNPDEAENFFKREYLRTRVAADRHWEPDLLKMWKMRLSLLRDLAEQLNIEPEQLELAGSTTKTGLENVCPLCSATYQEGVRECVDCFVPLKPAKVPAPGVELPRISGAKHLESGGI